MSSNMNKKMYEDEVPPSISFKTIAQIMSTTQRKKMTHLTTHKNGTNNN